MGLEHKPKAREPQRARLVRGQTVKWLTMRPDFAFGGMQEATQNVKQGREKLAPHSTIDATFQNGLRQAPKLWEKQQLAQRP